MWPWQSKTTHVSAGSALRTVSPVTEYLPNELAELASAGHTRARNCSYPTHAGRRVQEVTSPPNDPPYGPSGLGDVSDLGSDLWAAGTPADFSDSAQC